MPVKMKVLCYVLLLACVAAQEPSQGASEPSSERLDKCARLGFDADALDCKICADLNAFLGKSSDKKKLQASNALFQECTECCTDFQKKLEADAHGKYASVVLGVSNLKLKRYPRVASFVEQRAPHIAKLEVKDVHSRLPVLQFFNAEGEKVEEVSVAHWDEDSITEFIESKLIAEESEQDVERSDEL